MTARPTARPTTKAATEEVELFCHQVGNRRESLVRTVPAVCEHILGVLHSWCLRTSDALDRRGTSLAAGDRVTWHTGRTCDEPLGLTLQTLGDKCRRRCVNDIRSVGTLT